MDKEERLNMYSLVSDIGYEFSAYTMNAKRVLLGCSSDEIDFLRQIFQKCKDARIIDQCGTDKDSCIH